MDTDIHSEIECLLETVASYAESNDPETLAVTYSDLCVLQEKIGGETDNLRFESDETEEIFESYERIKNELDPGERIDFINSFESTVTSSSKSIITKFKQEISDIGLSKINVPPQESDPPIDDCVVILLRAHTDVEKILRYIEGETEQQLVFEPSQRILSHYENFKQELGIEHSVEFVDEIESSLKEHQDNLASHITELVDYCISPDDVSGDYSEQSTDQLAGLYSSYVKVEDMLQRDAGVRKELSQEMELFIQGWLDKRVPESTRGSMRDSLLDELDHRTKRIKTSVRGRYQSTIEQQASLLQNELGNSADLRADMDLLYSVCRDTTLSDAKALRDLKEQCNTRPCRRIFTILVDAAQHPAAEVKILSTLQMVVEDSLEQTARVFIKDCETQLVNHIKNFRDRNDTDFRTLIDGYTNLLNVLSGASIEEESRLHQPIEDFKAAWDSINHSGIKNFAQDEYNTLQSSLKSELRKQRSAARESLADMHASSLEKLEQQFNKKYSDNAQRRIEGYTLLGQVISSDMSEENTAIDGSPPLEVGRIIEYWESVEQDLNNDRLDKDVVAQLRDSLSDLIDTRISTARNELFDTYYHDVQEVLDEFHAHNEGDVETLENGYTVLYDYVTNIGGENHESPGDVSDELAEFEMMWRDIQTSQYLEPFARSELQDKLQNDLKDRIDDLPEN